MMKNLEIGGLAWASEAITMIDKLIGETMKVLNLKYNQKEFGFEVECILPGNKAPGIYRFDRKFFPNHLPVKILDEEVQVGETVHVWIKEKELLQKEGWSEIEKFLTSPESPFKIGKGKKPYLGGAHKALVCLDHKFEPFVAIGGYRFSPSELKCVLKTDGIFNGKSASIKGSGGNWLYSSEENFITMPNGNTLKSSDINNLIDLLRRAKLV